MRPMYRVTFRIAEPEGASILDAVAVKVSEWINGNDLVSTRDTVPNAALSQEDTEIGNGVSFTSLRCDAPQVASWVCRFSHPDRDSSYLRWISEIGVSKHSNGLAYFSCSNFVGNIDGTLAPIRRSTTRPRIVENVLLSYPVKGEDALSANPVRLVSTTSSLKSFVDFLESPDRRHPVLFISAANMTDRPIVDPQRVASQLAGLAHVYVAENRFCSMGLRDFVINDLNCWDGGIRLYWPGFQQSDFPLRHRLWVPWRVKELDSLPGYFTGHVLGQLSNLSAYSHHPHSVSWDSIQATQRRLGLEQAKASGDWEATATAYADDNDQLREQMRQLQELIDERGVELEQKSAEAEQWRLAYQQARSGTSSDSDVEAPAISVPEAIERTNSKFGDKIAFCMNTNSDAETAYSAPEEVENVFKFLATTYFLAKTGKRSCSDINHSIREAIGAHWFYQGGQSILTMTTYPGWYQCLHNGKKLWLGEHVGTGVSKDPRQTIRIGFAWVEEEQKIVVGFIGQHQKSGKT